MKAEKRPRTSRNLVENVRHIRDTLRSDGTCWKLRKESQKSQMKTEVSRMSSGKGVQGLTYNERPP